MRERTITLNGVSKTYAMTGWRIGYLAGPPEFIRVVSALKAMVNVQAPTVSQWAAVAALDGPQEIVEEMRQTYDARRRLLLGSLDEMGFTYGMPRGGLYIWANTALDRHPRRRTLRPLHPGRRHDRPRHRLRRRLGRLHAHDPPPTDRRAPRGCRPHESARWHRRQPRARRVTHARDRDRQRDPPGQVSRRALRQQAEAILLAYGATPEEAAIQADARLQGELRGHPGQGQGMRGIARYCAMLENGGIVPGAPFEVLVDTPALALVDGHKGFGQVIAVRAMDLAIEKAREVGVGLVGVRHSNHLGITAYHAMRAADAAHDRPLPDQRRTGDGALGRHHADDRHQPWGIAAPTDLGFPLVLDMALSTSGKGMVRWYQREGKTIPTDWAYDVDGNLTDDPDQAMEGPLVPIGAFKGTGLSIMTDVLCGVLTGAAFGLTPYRDPTNHDVGHMLIAIDIERFMPFDDLSGAHAPVLRRVEGVRPRAGLRRDPAAGRTGAPPHESSGRANGIRSRRRDVGHAARPRRAACTCRSPCDRYRDRRLHA